MNELIENWARLIDQSQKRAWGRLLRSTKSKPAFSTPSQDFSPGDVQNIPRCLNELLVNFRDESSGADFGGSKFQTDGQLAQFRSVSISSTRTTIIVGLRETRLKINAQKKERTSNETAEKIINTYTRTVIISHMCMTLRNEINP